MTNAVFTSMLNNTFVAGQPHRVSDGQGGWLVSYVSLGTVQGRMAPRMGEGETEVADNEEWEVMHVLYVEADDAVGTAIARDYLITLPAAYEDPERVYEVKGVREPSLANEHLEIDCLQRQLAANEVLSGT